ncbi:hypothetical protein ABL78_6349 [Leptomonas seymouri]|uniref:Uncharacterized protein n=1 Tax=Leptomonas seymouri TaxID=5684 RepID=A0A0N1I265_LEPSE|nr:hypothetical protein ABL78_6349 [Leptomonas seymouri]|eukprot:KPI84588.1 hypothetical protein ABL78_6349 [Leptomonas seymouri]
MSPTNLCPSCQKLTTLSLCPRCDTATIPYLVTAEGMRADPHTADSQQSPSLVDLTLTDIDTISRSRCSRACYSSESYTLSTAEELKVRVEALLSENDELYAKLQGDRHQMLRSAMAIRNLHASTKQLHQQDREVIDGLRRENELLRRRLAQAEETPTDTVLAATRVLSKSSAQAVPAKTQQAEAEAVSVPPPTSVSPTTTTANKRKGDLADSAPLQSTDQALSSLHMDDVAALQNEIKRLNGLVTSKTEQLDALWERVERAEKYISASIEQIDYTQSLAQEEARNSARLSRHLASVGEPPADLASFMSIKDRRTPTHSMLSNSLTPSYISHREWRKGTVSKDSAAML